MTAAAAATPSLIPNYRSGNHELTGIVEHCYRQVAINREWNKSRYGWALFNYFTNKRSELAKLGQYGGAQHLAYSCNLPMDTPYCSCKPVFATLG